MNSPSWILFAAVLCFYGTCVDGHCLDVTDCTSLKSNEQKLDCIRKCNSAHDFSRTLPSSEQQNDDEEEGEEDKLSLDLLLSALSPDSSEAQDPTEDPLHSEERRSYSMEHFRWGKPMGRKRRPVKVFPSIALEVEPEESTERMRVERGQDAAADARQTNNNAKNNGKYRMTHFRWNSPPNKRYGGFMKPYTEQSHKPLFSLIRHVIVKDGQQSRN